MNNKTFDKICKKIRQRIIRSLYLAEGGHSGPSLSIVEILTYLYFEYLEKYDYVSIKPHASPVFHAIQYLLGNLDKKYLTSLRELHGLQSYPSRTIDPDIVDVSGGSVGIGSIAPNFAAISHQYLKDHQIRDNRKYKLVVHHPHNLHLDHLNNHNFHKGIWAVHHLLWDSYYKNHSHQ